VDEQYDLLIVGGGPAGLSAAINSVIRGCRVMVLDTGATKLSQAEKIDNYLGMPGLKGKEIMAGFTEHAIRMGVFLEKGKVTNILPIGNQFMVSYGSRVITAKAVILAVGVNRESSIKGEEEYIGKGLSYCATCDGMLFREKTAVVYGEAEDAPEEANYLAKIGVKVIYVSAERRPNELDPDIAWRRGKIAAILGEDVVKSVKISGENVEQIDTEGVFLLRNTMAPQSMVSGVQMQKGYISVDDRKMTNIPGIFACGDCTGPPLQIAKAAGEGLIAGQEAAKYAGQ